MPQASSWGNGAGVPAEAGGSSRTSLPVTAATRAKRGSSSRATSGARKPGAGRASALSVSR